MSRQKVRHLMQRAGLNELPLAHCRTREEFTRELSKMSDTQFLDTWARHLSFAATRMSDEELLRQLAEAKKQHHKEIL